MNMCAREEMLCAILLIVCLFVCFALFHSSFLPAIALLASHRHAEEKNEKEEVSES
jgi:hypothetical protein